MEIIDFLKAARRRLALVILLPLISMGAAAGFLLIQPTTYTATAVVDPPALVGSLDSQYTGAQGVNQFVSAFEATASGPVVRRAVAAETGVSTTLLNDGLVVSQRGTSASLSVVYTADKKGTVVPVLNGVTITTLRTLFESQVQSAQGRLVVAKKAVDDATAAIGAFTSKNSMADPQKAYEAQLSRVNSLVQQQASLTAAGNSVGAAAMASPIATAKADLAKFGPILTEYNTLTTARDTAIQGLGEANAKLSAASVQLANADPSKIVYIGGAHSVDRLPTILATTASVGAAAFFLTLVLVLILEVVAKDRRNRDAETTPAGTADGEPADAVVHGHSASPETRETDGAAPDQSGPSTASRPTPKDAKESGPKNEARPSLPHPTNRG